MKKKQRNTLIAVVLIAVALLVVQAPRQPFAILQAGDVAGGVLINSIVTPLNPFAMTISFTRPRFLLLPDVAPNDIKRNSGIIDYSLFAAKGAFGKQILRLEQCSSAFAPLPPDNLYSHGCSYSDLLCDLTDVEYQSCCEQVCTGVKMLYPPTSVVCNQWCPYDIGPDMRGFKEGDRRIFVNELEVWVDAEECVLEQDTMVIAETFSAGYTVSKTSLRFAPIAYCSQLPILVTSEGEMIGQLLEEYQIMNDSFVTIPAGQTWTFFYITEVTEEITVICAEGSYNPETGECEVIPGIVWVCSVGVFDKDEGLCVVQPDVRYVCELGYFSVDRAACVYHIPDGQTTAICPAGSLIEVDEEGIDMCIFDADFDLLCGVGKYDISDKVCKFVPQPVPDLNIWQQIQGVFETIWVWLMGLFGW